MSTPEDMRLRALLEQTIETGNAAITERDRLKVVKAELLEALKEMVKQFTKTPSTLADTNARGKAHKAIAKAEGKQA